MKKVFQLLLCLTLVFEALGKPASVFPGNQNMLNERPIIGLLAQPAPSGYGDEYIRSAYVKFLESAGARVVPIRGKQPPEYYSSLFKKINGVLFPGGHAASTHGSYYESGKAMYELALKANDQGDYFPIWGTCLGLHVLTVLTARKSLLSRTDSKNLTMPLTLSDGHRESRMFRNMPDDVWNYLSFEPVTQNNHHKSMLVEDFKASSKLREFYKVLSTNHGRDNLEFVSLMEAYKYPIYASQWHPEKNIFLWSANSAINHGLHAIRISQYMANFFVSEARKSRHRFESHDQEAEEMIENAVRVFVPDHDLMTRYYFNRTTDTD